jgi:polyketide synthase PksJ
LELFLPLTVGAQVIIATRTEATDAERLVSLMETHNVSLLQATPATWKMLVDAEWRLSHPLKALCGGEALNPTLAHELLQQPSLTLWNMYGPTETTIWSCIQQIHGDEPQIVLGRPIANTQVYVVTNSLSLAPIGVPGELLIGGAGVARGYRNHPDLTAEKFIENPFYDAAASSSSVRLYRTGDLVRWSSDGNLEFLGRIDHQVKIRGFRIELGEVESALLTHDKVRDVVVLAKSAASGNRLVAYLVAEDVDNDTLRRYLAERLPEYMIPASFMHLDRLPLTPNGKVDRKALPEPDLSNTHGNYKAPHTETEHALCAIWQEVLGIARIGTQDNFFDLGGHSLSSMRVLAAIRSQFGIDIPATTIFVNVTIETISAYIDAMRLNQRNAESNDDLAEEGTF